MINDKEMVIVTQSEFDKGFSIFNDSDQYEFIPCASDEESLAKIISEYQARYTIVGITQYDKKLYDSLPKMGHIARFGVGHENIDKKQATLKTLFCTNTPGVLDNSVAEHTIALIIEICRKVGTMDYLLKQGKWQDEPGYELEGKKIAIIGCGQIGSKVAFILKNGFKMQVVGYSKNINSMDGRVTSNSFDKILSSLEEALADVDFVSIHIPTNNDNRHFVNKNFMMLMPEKSWLINTSRGAVLDESALYEALIQRSFAGAALDVFENEPYEPAGNNGDLRGLPNIIMTPHIGSNTREANDRIAMLCMRNIDLARRREYDKMNLINSEILTKINENIT